jgi:hypothetical protein
MPYNYLVTIKKIMQLYTIDMHWRNNSSPSIVGQLVCTFNDLENIVYIWMIVILFLNTKSVLVQEVNLLKTYLIMNV